MLCRKTVELFTLLSHTQETGARRMGMTQELLALVTGLAHYLKILIRIALTGALRLEREQSVRDAMSGFLDKLHLLAVQEGNPAARRLLKGSNGEAMTPKSPFSPSHRDGRPSANPPSDLCVKCDLTVEEDCVWLGTKESNHRLVGQKKICPTPKAVNHTAAPRQRRHICL